MKKAIFTAFIFCLFFQNVLAQSTDFKNQMNTIFEHAFTGAIGHPVRLRAKPG
jgi:hypothetical protein